MKRKTRKAQKEKKCNNQQLNKKILSCPAVIFQIPQLSLESQTTSVGRMGLLLKSNSNIFIRNNNYSMITLEIKEMDMKNTHGKIKLENQQQKPSHQQLILDLKQIYICSCGKQYQSFPATYLHFRSKHNIKLSTKPTQKRRLIQIEGDTRRIKYLVDLNSGENNFQNSAVENTNSQNHDPSFCSEAKIINSCVQKYLKSSRHSSQSLYSKLINFFNIICQEKSHPQLPANLERIPYFLNDFTLFYLPSCSQSLSLGSQSWKEACVELSRFCNWLRKQKYTELILIYQRE